MKLSKLFLLSILLLVANIGYCNITMPFIFSSNMVLQRGQEIPIWGWASPGERVSVTLNNQKVNTKTGKDGKWSLKLKPESAGGPFTLAVKGKNSIELENVLVGDVWICSGQSNMEWPVSSSNSASKEIAGADYPDIRLFTVPKKIDKRPVDNTDPAEWLVCTSETIGPFSAVGYFFGRQLNQELDVPIGLINTSWGGTIVETWASAESIQNDPDLGDDLKELNDLDIEKANEQLLKEFEQWHVSFTQMDAGYKEGAYIWAKPGTDYSQWEEIELPALWEDSGLENMDGVVWFAKEIELTQSLAQSGFELNLGPIDDSDIVWINGSKVGETFNVYNRHRKYQVDPDNLKNGINTIVIRVEDYAGGGGIYGDASQMKIVSASNSMSLAGTWKYKIGTDKLPPNKPSINFGPNSYPTLLFNAMINPLLPYGIKGAIWYQGESNAGRAYQYRRLFPLLITDWRNHWQQGDFPFLFVQLANFMQSVDVPAESAWAELREAQTMTLSLPNTGMATIIDIGEADDIHPRNKQDVGKRLALSAFKIAYGKDIVFTGPTYESIQIDGQKAIVKFNNTGSGLLVKDKYNYLKGFTIAGDDKVFHWAKAEIIDDQTIIITSNEVSDPVAVRYAWANNPDEANLYNKEGLPANPFRTDSWPGITIGQK